MSRWICVDEFEPDTEWSEYEDGFTSYSRLQIDSVPSIDICFCRECRRVREDGGHANCNGYLYCRKWKTLVDEDSYCSWGEREGE